LTFSVAVKNKDFFFSLLHFLSRIAALRNGEKYGKNGKKIILQPTEKVKMSSYFYISETNP